MADTGSVHLCIPESIRDRLALEPIEDKPVVLADGSRRSVACVGLIELRFGGRTGFSGALVMCDQPLLGVIPMEDMDLVVVPKTRQVIPNPGRIPMRPGQSRCRRCRAEPHAGAICISAIAHAELCYGVEHSKQVDRNRHGLAEFLRDLDVVAFDRVAGSHYGDLHETLTRKGTPIGANDVLICGPC